MEALQKVSQVAMGTKGQDPPISIHIFQLKIPTISLLGGGRMPNHQKLEDFLYYSPLRPTPAQRGAPFQPQPLHKPFKGVFCEFYFGSF